MNTRPNTLPVTNPYTGATVATYPIANPAQVDRVVVRADNAFKPWSRTPTTDRIAIMRKAAQLLRDRAEDFAKTITREMGKPIKEAQAEVKSSAELIDYFAEEALRITGGIPKLDLTDELPMVFKQPVGVVAAITAFNYPLALLVWKVGPALGTGCTLVAKPDEHAPTVAIQLAEVFVEAGLPDGVFQIVTGNAATGKTLINHPLIRKIAFTGSVATGLAVGAAAVAQGKRITLEMGGQCPAIITAGADITSLMPDFIRNTFNNAGQYCYRINRAYVQAEVYDEFIEKLTVAANKLQLGDPTQEDTDMGPLCHQGVYDKAMAHIADAVAKGGIIRCGGKRLGGKGFEQGFFMQPTVIKQATHDMLVMQEESFGPVLAVQKIASLNEGIRLANDSQYGLAAYVFTGDTGTGLRAAQAIEAGMVWVNKIGKAYHVMPFGGMKQSGIGREKSRYGLDEYLELKAVYLGLGEGENYHAN